ncbi:MAG: hypothetical protein WCI72_02310 [archaeon]
MEKSAVVIDTHASGILGSLLVGKLSQRGYGIFQFQTINDFFEYQTPKKFFGLIRAGHTVPREDISLCYSRYLSYVEDIWGETHPQHYLGQTGFEQYIHERRKIVFKLAEMLPNAKLVMFDSITTCKEITTQSEIRPYLVKSSLFSSFSIP